MDTFTPATIFAPADEAIIVITRTLDAPRALVWKALSEPRHLARWWGPHGYANKVTRLDMKVGGGWRIETTDLKGNTIIFHGQYREVVPPRRIVQTFGMEGMFDGRMIVETMTLDEVDGRTLYKVVSRLDSIADRDGMIASGMERGLNQGMERLDVLLEELKQEG